MTVVAYYTNTNIYTDERDYSLGGAGPEAS